ncbi:MAG: TonB-dependent receptor [Bacteroidales bacterium]
MTAILRTILTGFLALIILAGNASEAKKYTISGHVKDAENGENLIGASIFIDELKSGTITNLYGFYSVSMPAGEYTLIISYIGYASERITLNLRQNTTREIELKPRREVLQAFVITGENKSENITGKEMGAIKMEIRTIEKIPALLGEVDVIKAIQLLPGVQSAGEGSTGFSVRGGSKDQNLILLDEATIYNASHLLGFFSIFNNDAIKEVKLYKGDIPARYGGRLSSLLEIQQKDGNMKRMAGQGGIGTVSSRFTLEGPLIKDKSSFVLSGRRSYADLFLKLSKREELKNNKLYFYDLNTKINLIANANNRLYLSAYSGRDIVSLSPSAEFPPFRMGWGNNSFTLRWNHLFSPKLFANFSAIYSKYDYRLGIDDNVQGFEWVSMMDDHSLKGDFVYYLNPDYTVRFGWQSTYHDFWPGLARGNGDQTIFGELKIPVAKALEHGFYLSSDQQVSKNISFNYGVRYSLFQNMGPGTVYRFDDNFNPLDSVVYPSGEIFNAYGGWEPRISMVIQIDERSSVKSSYNRTMQYIHLASNATIGSPLDVYLPSGPNIKPQSADQIAVGYYRNFLDNNIETSVEVYYKQMDNQVDFKDHAELILNPRIEGEVRIAEGEAYGIEMLVRKQSGKLTGWIGYTWSKSTRVSEWINDGNIYLSPYDRTHDISVVASYQYSNLLSFSATWVYATGAPVTFPTGRFVYGNVIAPVYSDRNSYRLPAYHRLDLGVTFDPVSKKSKSWESSWTFSVYNAYNRHNAFVINFVRDKANPNVLYAEMIYLFPIIPAITYNFKF